MKTRVRDFGPVLLLAALYFVAGKLGLKLAFIHVSASPVWPPTGIALASLLLAGRRLWPGVFLGAFLVNITTTGGLAASLGIAAGNTLEAVAGAALVERFAAGRRALERPSSILRFIVLAALLSTTISASVGVASLVGTGLAPAAAAGAIWLTWWLGDAAGALIAAPALLLWDRGDGRPWSRARLAELAGLALSVLVTGGVVFGWLIPSAADLPLDFLCLPVLLWPAFRFGPRETALAACVLSALAIQGTLSGCGPFVRSTPNESLLLLQAFMALTSIAAVTVSAVIAERRAAAHALRAARDELESRVAERTAALSQANAELGLFASIAAHELQEPLRKLLMFGSHLKTTSPSDPEGAEDLERMQGSAERMSRLVQDILALSRVTTNAGSLERVDLDRFIAELKADFAERFADAGAELTAQPMPAVRADPAQLRQLFVNLVSNAYKFRDKQRPLRVSISSRRPRDGFLEIAVEDNGIGFEERFGERIFKPFQRLHRRGEYEGSGMGLAICARIALRHGGSIEAHGTPGAGSRFVVTLPHGDHGEDRAA